MSVLDVKSPRWEVVIASAQPIEPVDAVFRDLMNSLDRLDAKVPFAGVEVTSTARSYTYSATAGDGRTWSQTAKFTGEGVEPTLTFDIKDEWTRSEFVQHLFLQEFAEKLVVEFGLISLIINRGADAL